MCLVTWPDGQKCHHPTGKGSNYQLILATMPPEVRPTSFSSGGNGSSPSTPVASSGNQGLKFSEGNGSPDPHRRTGSSNIVASPLKAADSPQTPSKSLFIGKNVPATVGVRVTINPACNPLNKGSGLIREVH